MAIYKTARPWEDLKHGAQLGFFFRNQLGSYVSKKNIFLQNITRY
jgi:hypothetical protein